METQKPATPLPQLRAFPDPRPNNKLFCIGTADEIPYIFAVVHGSLNATREQRAEQIVAACNAYPQLVEDRRMLLEALHGAIGALDALRSLGTLAEEVSRKDALLLAEDAERDARALLRDLGEIR